MNCHTDQDIKTGLSRQHPLPRPTGGEGEKRIKGQQAEPDTLVSYSERDKPWDVHKGQTQAISQSFLEINRPRYAHRTQVCAESLEFAWVTDEETGESRLVLHHALFCRVRQCPICQWRRSMMWKARFYQALPTLVEAYPNARWVLLTLTVKNCPITGLRDTIRAMNKAWQRFIKRQEFSRVIGWVRSTEVTKGEDDTAHPHFHVLLMVNSSWFNGRYYTTQERWTEIWQACLRADYKPIVHIKAVKGDVKDAAIEVLKYTTKPDDYLHDKAWLAEYISQVHKMRFIATGGTLKDVLKVHEETDEEMIHTDEENTSEGDIEASTLTFAWDGKKHYRKHKR